MKKYAHKSNIPLSARLNNQLLLHAARINFEEFQARNITAMAHFIRQIKEAAPETRSRYSDQAWINTASRPHDKVLKNIQER